MTHTRSSRPAAQSRRRFLKVVTFGTAAAVAAVALPGSGQAAVTPAKGAAKSKTAVAPPPTAVETEVARQKQSIRDQLKTIRDFELPSGSELAFAFVPSRAAKRKPTPRVSPAAGGTR